MLKAGFARRVITPAKAMTLAGFDRRTEAAQGALEALYVTVLALQTEDEAPFLLCSFDLLGTDHTLCEKVRQALQLPPERVWVCATHTHARRGAHFPAAPVRIIPIFPVWSIAVKLQHLRQ